MTEINLASVTCLLVDDDKFARTFIKNALFQIGVKFIKEAGDTKEATEILSMTKMDIILLDQNMPEQNGVDFAKEIRSGKIAGMNTVPIIMITSESHERIVKAAKEVGINAYLIKPISPAILKKRMAAILGS